MDLTPLFLNDVIRAWLSQLPLAALAGGLLALIIGTLVMNRGNRWVLNVLAQDEPFVFALGFALYLWDGGALVMGQSLGLWVGLALMLVAVVSRYTDLYDISGVVG